MKRYFWSVRHFWNWPEAEIIAVRIPAPESGSVAKISISARPSVANAFLAKGMVRNRPAGDMERSNPSTAGTMPGSFAFLYRSLPERDGAAPRSSPAIRVRDGKVCSRAFIRCTRRYASTIRDSARRCDFSPFCTASRLIA